MRKENWSGSTKSSDNNFNVYCCVLRKLTAISFLALLLFNLAGYRVWLYYASHLSDRILQASLDNEEYDSSQLVTIRMPFCLPYANSGPEFERVTGEIEVEGRVYKLVKRWVYEGELILLCIPNDQKTRVRAAGADYFKGVNDLAGLPGSPKQKNSFLKLLQGEYDDRRAVWRPDPTVSLTGFKHPTDETRWPSPSYAIPGQPPDTGTA